jgi:hypothetical protein
MPADNSADVEFAERLQQAKLESLKELAYGASHEINNPLANIATRAQALLQDERRPERRRSLEAIHEQALRAHEMISDLMLFARPPKLERKQTDLAAVVRQAVEGINPECRRREIELAVSIDEDLPNLHADGAQLAVAIRALVVNAMEAVGRQGSISVSAARSDANRKMISLKVRDNGPGIPPEMLPKIFDPFFSGREAGRGLGFGLSKCWRIVTDHDGRISANSTPGEGAVFTIEIPAV